MLTVTDTELVITN